MKQLPILFALMLAVSLAAPLPALGSDEPLAVLDQHYRLLETGDFDQAREGIYTAHLKPEELQAIPHVMQGLHDEITRGGGFGEIKITQKTPCEVECVWIGLLVLKDGTRKPNAWKMILDDGQWKVAYSRQMITQHKKK